MFMFRQAAKVVCLFAVAAALVVGVRPVVASANSGGVAIQPFHGPQLAAHSAHHNLYRVGHRRIAIFATTLGAPCALHKASGVVGPTLGYYSGNRSLSCGTGHSAWAQVQSDNVGNGTFRFYFTQGGAHSWVDISVDCGFGPFTPEHPCYKTATAPNTPGSDRQYTGVDLYWSDSWSGDISGYGCN